MSFCRLYTVQFVSILNRFTFEHTNLEFTAIFFDVVVYSYYIHLLLLWLYFISHKMLDVCVCVWHSTFGLFIRIEFCRISNLVTDQLLLAYLNFSYYYCFKFDSLPLSLSLFVCKYFSRTSSRAYALFLFQDCVCISIVIVFVWRFCSILYILFIMQCFRLPNSNGNNI